MVIAGRALLVAVVFIEAQLRIRTGRAEMARMILAVVVATAANARKMAIPVPDVIVEYLLCLANKMTEGFHCLPTSGLALTFRFFLFAAAQFKRVLRAMLRTAPLHI